MKKYVIFSSDDNPNYYFFLPIASLAWKNIGYEPIISFVLDKQNLSSSHKLVLKTCESFGATTFIIDANEIKSRIEFRGYNLSMLAQISRFCPSIFLPNDNVYCLTSDADMIPVDNKWFHQQDSTKEIHLFQSFSC